MPLTVRLLSDGPTDALRDAVVGLGNGPSALAAVASVGVVEALAIGQLRSDETRVVESQAQELRIHTLADQEGTRLVLLGPLLAVAELPGRLREWGAAGENAAAAIAAALQSRGASLPRWTLAGAPAGDGRIPVSIGPGEESDIPSSRIVRVAQGESAEPPEAALLLLDIEVADDPDRDRVMAGLAAALATAEHARLPADRSGVALRGPLWLLPRLGQLRPLGRALAWDCGDAPAGAAVAAAVLGAAAGAAAIISNHPAAVRDGLRTWTASA